MKTRLTTLLIAVAIGAMLVGSAAFAAGFSYTEDFGIGAASDLSDLGWTYLPDFWGTPSEGGRLIATEAAAGLIGTTGRALAQFTAGGSLPSHSYGYLHMKKDIPGMTAPLSGLWVYSAVVNAPQPTNFDPTSWGDGSHNSYLGVSNGSAVMANWFVNRGDSWTGTMPTPSWVLNYGGFMNTGTGSWNLPPSADWAVNCQTYLFDTPVVTSIFMDFNTHEIWGTVSNGNPIQTLISPKVTWTASNPAFDSLYVYMSSIGGRTGFNVDNITVASVPEPGALTLLASGLLGLAGVVCRRRK